MEYTMRSDRSIGVSAGRDQVSIGMHRNAEPTLRTPVDGSSILILTLSFAFASRSELLRSVGFTNSRGEFRDAREDSRADPLQQTFDRLFRSFIDWLFRASDAYANWHLDCLQKLRFHVIHGTKSDHKLHELT